MASRKKLWHIVTLITFIFAIPFIFAVLFYTHSNWLPKHKLNHGQLLTPPLSIQQLSLKPAATQHRWVLLWVNPGVCDSSCQKALYNMQQVQRALGKDMNRLQRVLLTTPANTPDAQLQQWLLASATLHWQVNQDLLTRVLGRPAAWYVIDPLGNMVLSYQANINPEAILDDLKFLMGVSSIG